MKIIVFNPILTYFGFCKLLKTSNIKFEICFFVDHSDDNCIVKFNIENGLLDEAEKNNFNHYYYDEKNFSFSQEDLLIPCDDRSAKLVDRLLCERNSIFSDDQEFLKLRLDKKEYLRFLNNDILDKIQFPCVVKPTISGGGYNTHFINDETDLEKLSGIITDDMIIQKMYNGQEYAIDVVSKNGTHHFIGAWKYTTNKNSVVRTKIELLPPNESPIKDIFDYVSSCLNKIGKRNGATHTEVIVSETDMRLVEINFRFHGHSFHKHYIEGTDESHFSAFIKLFITQEKVNFQYHYKNYIAKIRVNLNKRLNLPNINYKVIESLPSVIHVIKHNPIVPNTTLYGPTVDLQSCLCYIMVHFCKDTYEQDISIINSWIKEINNEKITDN